MSLYSHYITERTDKQILETDKGFAVYSFTKDSIYIEDIFVLKDFRKENVASEMADKIAEIGIKEGKQIMLGSVVPSCKGGTTSLKVLLAYGFELNSATANFILLSKKIGDNNG